MNLSTLATSRYATKAYDPARRIPEALMEQLRVLLRHAPSSVNSQPWHFIIAASDAAKARIASATTGPYAANEPRVLNASHVVVFCARADLDDAHLERVLDQEERDGRFPGEEARAAQAKGRGYYVNMHRNELRDTRCWMEKQVYIALGTLLFGAAALEIDATPIEGFDPALLDQALELEAQGLRPVVMAALGYHGADDFNAGLPKSRLPEASLFTTL
ncbi:MAG: oxygen-insensitive NAD(P)H nitroreductase [gamma proteobacterium symbiont of Phacoides pectinatus]